MIRRVLDWAVRQLPDPAPLEIEDNTDEKRVWTLDQVHELPRAVVTDWDLQPVRLDPVLSWLTRAAVGEPTWGYGHPFLTTLIERRKGELARQLDAEEHRRALTTEAADR